MLFAVFKRTSTMGRATGEEPKSRRRYDSMGWGDHFNGTATGAETGVDYRGTWDRRMFGVGKLQAVAIRVIH